MLWTVWAIESSKDQPVYIESSYSCIRWRFWNQNNRGGRGRGRKGGTVTQFFISAYGSFIRSLLYFPCWLHQSSHKSDSREWFPYPWSFLIGYFGSTFCTSVEYFERVKKQPPDKKSRLNHCQTFHETCWLCCTHIFWLFVTLFLFFVVNLLVNIFMYLPQNLFPGFKGYLRYKTILRHKVALDV